MDAEPAQLAPATYLLSHPVCSASEAACAHSKLISLILQCVKSLSTLIDLVYILLHVTDNIVDLLDTCQYAIHFMFLFLKAR